MEREAYAAAILAARMEDGGLDDAPIWSDVVTFDGRPWRGVVDCVTGGFPCQDISVAGKGAGIKEGTRSGLWFEYARIIREVGPRFVFVENVAALARRGLDIVLGDLAAMGFDAEWGVFSAAEAGAPHRRERLFVLAHTRRVCIDRLQPDGFSGSGDSLQPSRARDPMADAIGEVGIGSEESGRRDGDVGHADDTGLEGRSLCGLGGADERPTWPPGPADADGWVEYLRRWPQLEPVICRGADGLANRVDRLRACGNGVVPQQAALAWRTLWKRSGLT